MNKLEQILIIVFTFAILKYIIKLVSPKKPEHFTLFTAHPPTFTLSKFWDDLDWHAYINDSGNAYILSHKPPRRPKCRKIKCPESYKSKQPIIGKKYHCWQC